MYFHHCGNGLQKPYFCCEYYDAISRKLYNESPYNFGKLSTKEEAITYLFKAGCTIILFLKLHHDANISVQCMFFKKKTENVYPKKEKLDMFMKDMVKGFTEKKLNGSSFLKEWNPMRNTLRHWYYVCTIHGCIVQFSRKSLLLLVSKSMVSNPVIPA